MKIDYHHYKLPSKTSISHRKAHKIREGIILKFTFNTGIIGYADCHPWTELGDLPIEEQLALIHSGRAGETPICLRSFTYAYMDAKARAKGINLLNGLIVPKSHFLLGSIEDEEDFGNAITEGFTHFKIKMGLQLEAEIKAIKRLAARMPRHGKLRIDFNLKLTQEDFLAFLTQIEDCQAQFDFFEDPFHYQEDAWKDIQQRTRLSLACDEQIKDALEQPEGADVLVIKPAVMDPSLFAHLSKRVVATSYLDHPLGQVSAAYEAAQLGLGNEICGLLSHRVYQTNEFSECLAQRGPDFVAPTGTGFGFDDLLKNLEFAEIFNS